MVALRSTLPSVILTVLPSTTVEICRGWAPESRHATEVGLMPKNVFFKIINRAHDRIARANQHSTSMDTT